MVCEPVRLTAGDMASTVRSPGFTGIGSCRCVQLSLGAALVSRSEFLCVAWRVLARC